MLAFEKVRLSELSVCEGSNATKLRYATRSARPQRRSSAEARAITLRRFAFGNNLTRDHHVLRSLFTSSRQ